MAKEQYFAHPPRGHVAILAYDDVNNRWQVLECTEDGYLKTRLQEVNGTVLVQQYMPSLLQPGINTYDGSAWHKQPLIWGYTDRWVESLDESASDVGYVLAESIAVPAGYVYVLEAASLKLDERETTIASISAICGEVYVALVIAATLAANTHLPWTGRITLKEGDKVNMFVMGAQEGDTFVGRVWGYKMAIGM